MLLRARLKWKGVHLVHVNEIVAIAAVVFSKLLFRCPVVVHVRSVQDARHARQRSRFIGHVLRGYADAVIAIDETVRRSLPPGIVAEVVHNAYATRSDAATALSEEPHFPSRQPGTLRVAMVGSLLAFKGVREFVEAARLCRLRDLPVEFLMVGVNTRRSPGSVEWLLKATGLTHDAPHPGIRIGAKRPPV